ncbi:MAG: alkaline phosphatase family protein [Candidatus Hermodarchaeota archaeon]
MNKISRVIYCIIDNVRSDYLFDLINKGMLPNISKLMENGIYSKNCITDFPPITYPTQASMITGTYTGDYRKEFCHGIPLMNWMGRDTAPPFLRDYTAKSLQIYKLNKDLGYRCKTILEMVGDENTASISQFINRGAKYYFPERPTKLAMFYLTLFYSRKIKGMIARADTGLVQKLIDTFRRPNKYFDTSEPPIASLLWFPTTDVLLHIFGSSSQIYKLNLLHIDKVIGVLVESLENLGYLGKTAIVVTSDHGNYKAERLGNPFGFFKANKLTHYQSRRNIKGNMNISRYDGIGFFNFKGSINSGNKNVWAHPTIKEMENYGPKKVNLLQGLFKIEGSHLMYYRDENSTHDNGSIHLKRKIKGIGKIISGSIEYKGTGSNFKTKYSIENGELDIFDYINDDIAGKLIDNKFHTIQEWLGATYHLDYPLYPDLITRHFKNPRSSDIILSNDGTVVYNLKNGKNRNKNLNNHDIGTRDCMNIPLFIGGSLDIPHKQIPYCKITDIVPTLLQMLGKNIHKSVVGQSLI